MDEEALFRSMMLVKMGKTSDTLRAAALALPPECSSDLFAAAAHLDRAIEAASMKRCEPMPQMQFTLPV